MANYIRNIKQNVERINNEFEKATQQDVVSRADFERLSHELDKAIKSVQDYIGAGGKSKKLLEEIQVKLDNMKNVLSNLKHAEFDYKDEFLETVDKQNEVFKELINTGFNLNEVDVEYGDLHKLEYLERATRSYSAPLNKSYLKMMQGIRVVKILRYRQIRNIEKLYSTVSNKKKEVLDSLKGAKKAKDISKLKKELKSLNKSLKSSKESILAGELSEEHKSILNNLYDIFKGNAFKKDDSGNLTNSYLDSFAASFDSVILNALTGSGGIDTEEKRMQAILDYNNRSDLKKLILPKGKVVLNKSGSNFKGWFWLLDRTREGRRLTKRAMNVSDLKSSIINRLPTNEKTLFEEIFEGYHAGIKDEYKSNLSSIKSDEQRDFTSTLTAFFDMLGDLKEVAAGGGTIFKNKKLAHFSINKELIKTLDLITQDLLKNPLDIKTFTRMGFTDDGVIWRDNYSNNYFKTDGSFNGDDVYVDRATGEEIKPENLNMGSGNYSWMHSQVTSIGKKKWDINSAGSFISEMLAKKHPKPPEDNIIIKKHNNIETEEQIEQSNDRENDKKYQRLGSAEDCCCCKQRSTILFPMLQGAFGTINTLLNQMSMQLAEIDAHVQSKLGGSTEATVQEAIDEDNNKKANYQVKQDSKDRKRAEQKSFIDMLIPELKKLLPKKMLWDALKLLLFRFGAVHPKLAAAALLAGPALAGGALKLGVRSLLGIPGWAAGGVQTVAKAGTFGGPIANTKNWFTAVKANTFSGNGIYTNLTNTSSKIAQRRASLNAIRQSSTYLEPTIFVDSHGTAISGLSTRAMNAPATARQLKRLELLEKSTTRLGTTTAYTKAIGSGLMGNASMNWAKYSKGGTVGTLKTLGNATKGIPGFAALLEVITDIPDIMSAATSGKKGALTEQLSKTLGGVVGAIVGAFFGPVGLILGPLLGRSIGEGFGKHSKGISESLGRLGSAFSELLRVCEPLIKLFKVSFSWLGEVLAGVFMGLIDTVTALVSAITSAIHNIRMLVDDDYKKQFEQKEKQEKYIRNLETPGSAQYTRMQQKAEDLLRKEYKSLSYEEKTGNVAEFRAAQPGTKIWDPTKATQAQLDAIEKQKREAKKREDEWVKERLKQKTDELVNKEIERTKGVLKVNQTKATLGNGALSAVAAAAATGTTGACLGAVENAFEKTYGVNLGRQQHAYQAASVLDNYANQGLVERHSWSEYKTKDGKYGGLKNLPANAIVVWSKGTSKSGHISIANGNGQEISDHIQEQMTSHYGGGVPTVYIPKMNSKLTPQQIEEIKTNYVSQQVSNSSTSNATAISEAETTDGVRDALLKLAGAVGSKHAQDTADAIVFNATDVTGSMGCWGIVQLNNEGRPVH